MSESRDAIKRKMKEIENERAVNKSSTRSCYITRAAKAANSSATKNNKPTTRSTANNNNSMALATTNQLDSNDPDVRRSHRTNSNPYSSNRELNRVGSSSTRGPLNGRPRGRQTKDKSANAQTITSTEMIAQAKSDISNIIIPTVSNNNDVVMIQEDDQCNTGTSEQRAGSSTRGPSNRHQTKDKSANAQTITSTEMIAQAMLDINASVTSDKKQDITFVQLCDGTKKARELDENNEQNTDGRAAVHRELFAFGGDNRDTNSTGLGIVSITQISTRMNLGEVFGWKECYNLIGGCAVGENSTKKKYDTLVKGDIDSFDLKDFEMTRYDKKNGLAAPPTNDQLAKINAINKQYNPNEANQASSSNGRVAATTAITNTFHRNVRGRKHTLDSSKQIITAPSLTSLIQTLKCIHLHSDGKKTLSVCKAMKSIPPGGSLDWRGGITIEYFDEKKHGKYVDDTEGISTRGNKVKSSGKQPTAKRRKRGKWGQRYTS